MPMTEAVTKLPNSPQNFCRSAVKASSVTGGSEAGWAMVCLVLLRGVRVLSHAGGGEARGW